MKCRFKREKHCINVCIITYIQIQLMIKTSFNITFVTLCWKFNEIGDNLAKKWKKVKFSKIIKKVKSLKSLRWWKLEKSFDIHMFTNNLWSF